MPISTERQYRSLQPLQINQSNKRLDTGFYIEGYATTWARYILWEDQDGPIYEEFKRDAFTGCDMSDVIMQYDHAGKVLARQSNQTLLVETNENGLFICADLGKSKAAQEMFDEIQSGLVTKMSWTFAPGEYHFDQPSRTLIHEKVKKVFDVSAVSIPANDATEIHARSFVDGEILKVMQELQERQKKILSLKLKLEGI